MAEDKMGDFPNGDATMETDEKSGPTEWDEERLEAAQKVLKEMYIQLRELRSTLPRLVAPLTTKQPSPQKLFNELSAAAGIANAEVKQFRELMERDQSKEILDHAKESQALNPKGIVPWRITEDPNWSKRD